MVPSVIKPVPFSVPIDRPGNDKHLQKSDLSRFLPPLGMAIFIGGCFGCSAAMKFSPLPVVFASVGLVVSIVGGVKENGRAIDTQVLAAVFAGVVGLLGGLGLMAFQYGWGVFAKGA